tara:strand:- start:295 stop:492 length:198 start_codon:yes stop_codon:yes gene_type:complete
MKKIIKQKGNLKKVRRSREQALIEKALKAEQDSPDGQWRELLKGQKFESYKIKTNKSEAANAYVK